MALILPSVTETVDAAAGTSTAYTLGIGQSAQGTLSVAGDDDWYTVNLVAGQTYSFALIGTGTHALRNPLLILRNSNGTQLAINDDGGPAFSSSITFTASVTGTYYLDASSSTSAGTGQYGISASTGTKPNFDVPMGGGALDAFATWSLRGTGATITYGFRASPAPYTVQGHNVGTFSQVSPAEMAAVQQILQEWGDVANVTFQQVNPGGYTDNATILIGNYADPNDGAGAFAFFPGSTASTAAEGDLWLNLSGGVSTSSVPVGSFSYFAIMHELGHALGLSHPGDYNAAPGQTITYANNAQFVQDTEQNTVMSYFGGALTGELPGGFATGYTPMLFDIYELQQLYGANATTRAGDTIYGFGSTAGSLYAFSTTSIPAYCIWDAGGTDTLDCSAYGAGQVINLNQGTYSNIGGGQANISIAIGAVIENAKGGFGNDTILGNDANNALSGSFGNDTIDGGLGFDTAIFSGNKASYAISFAGQTTTVSGPDGTDTLTNIEMLQFADISIPDTPVRLEVSATTAMAVQGGATEIALLSGPATITDPNSGTMTGATIHIQSTTSVSIFPGDELFLNGVQNGVVSGVTVSWNDSTKVLTLTGAAPTATYEALLGQVTYKFLDIDGTNNHIQHLVTWTVNDGTQNLTTTSIVATDHAPVAANDGKVAARGAILHVAANGVLANDVDQDLDTLSVAAVNGQAGNVGHAVVGSYGQLTLNPDGSYSYTLDAGAPVGGTDPFTYTVADGHGGTSTATLTITIGAGSTKGDLTGDAVADVLWRDSSTGTVEAWVMNNGNVGSTSMPGMVSSAWQLAGTGDINGDHVADLIWRNTSSGAVESWLINNGQMIGGAGVGMVSSAWQVVGVGDFNGDGAADVLWRNTTTGAIESWLLGNGHMTGGTGVGTASSAWQPLGVGDFNGDGTKDVVWQNSSTGEVDTWLMQSGHIVGGIAIGVQTAAWKSLGVGDFDGDGTADLLWQNTATGEVDTWLMQNDHVTTVGVLGSMPSGWQVGSIGDFYGTGTADILWHNAATGASTVWQVSNDQVVGNHSLPTMATNWQIQTT